MPQPACNVTMGAIITAGHHNVQYHEFDNMLKSLSGGAVHASESHGTLIGVFSAMPQTAVEDWMAALAADAGVELEPMRDELDEAARLLVARLAAEDLSFQLLLPEDEAPLSERVAALAGWCQGYLYGLTQGGIKQYEGLPGDCEEILNDFAQMTAARTDEDSEGGERDFFELTEYVRVGAQLVFEELSELAAKAADSPSRAH